jgi:GntR family transcriptional regulator/MocR family aminotransferase
MMAERGMPIRPAEVIIVSGIRQACYILSRVLLDGGFAALVDGLLPRSAAWIFSNIGTNTLHVPPTYRPSQLDADGHKLAWLNTPHPHAPPEIYRDWRERRSALLAWAQQTGGYLVEYEGLDHILFLAPPAATSVSDRDVRVGEFSPTLGLGTRMGYMIVPASLVERVTAFKQSLGAPPPLEQAALARFIENGGYSRHLRRVGKVMIDRRAALISALQSHFADAMPDEPTAEDHLSCRFSEAPNRVALIRKRAHAAGIALDISEHRASNGGTRGEHPLTLSYSRMNEHLIKSAIGRLAVLVHGTETGCANGHVP